MVIVAESHPALFVFDLAPVQLADTANVSTTPVTTPKLRVFTMVPPGAANRVWRVSI